MGRGTPAPQDNRSGELRPVVAVAAGFRAPVAGHGRTLWARAPVSPGRATVSPTPLSQMAGETWTAWFGPFGDSNSACRKLTFLP